jgi:lysophospholipase
MGLTIVICLMTVFSNTILAQSASSPYAPIVVQCPSDLHIRPAKDGLSTQEQQWRKLRLKNVASSLSPYLKTANIPGFNITEYIGKVNASTVPIAGLAIAGGGSQSGMGGLGLWQAFDDRYAPAVKAGTGGLAQCLSYLSGLSGGGIYTVVPL